MNSKRIQFMSLGLMVLMSIIPNNVQAASYDLHMKVIELEVDYDWDGSSNMAEFQLKTFCRDQYGNWDTAEVSNVWRKRGKGWKLSIVLLL